MSYVIQELCDEIGKLKQALAEKDLFLAQANRHKEELFAKVAEKDREITHLQDVYTKQRFKLEDAYQQLMEKAVRFGECLTDDCRCTPEEVNTSPECAFIRARLFLQSPEVQAWKEQQS